jgi:hypothetical protein
MKAVKRRKNGVQMPATPEISSAILATRPFEDIAISSPVNLDRSRFSLGLVPDTGTSSALMGSRFMGAKPTILVLEDDVLLTMHAGGLVPSRHYPLDSSFGRLPRRVKRRVLLTAQSLLRKPDQMPCDEAHTKNSLDLPAAHRVPGRPPKRCSIVR